MHEDISLDYRPEDIVSNQASFFELLKVGVETNCRYIWQRHQCDKKDTYHEWISVGQRKNTEADLKTVSDIYSIIDSSNELTTETYRCDVFLSPNQFFDWRCRKSLALLHANYLEIDTKKHCILSEKESEEVICDVLQQITLQAIPFPNSIVSSGSGGWHLYWIYEPVEAYRWRQELWTKFASELLKKIVNGDNWEIDVGASLDPTRVLRLPGSLHQRSQREVKVYSFSRTTYSFDELLKQLDINPSRPNHLKIIDGKKSKLDNTKRKLTKAQLNVYQTNYKHNIRRWWENIYNKIVEHCESNEIGKGKRDYAAFLLFVAKRQFTNDDEDEINEAFKEIRRINKQHIGLTDKELKSYLTSARKTKYRYRKEKLAKLLADTLGMDISFLYKTTEKVRLSLEEVKEKQRNSAKVTATKKRKKTLETLRKWLAHLEHSKTIISTSKLAEVSGKSIRTVRRYWPELLQNKAVIRSVSI